MNKTLTEVMDDTRKYLYNCGILRMEPTEENFLKSIQPLIIEAKKEGAREMGEKIVKNYDNKIKEYEADGLTLIAKLMVDVRDIALEEVALLSPKPISNPKE
jgi:hypothetical protein